MRDAPPGSPLFLSRQVATVSQLAEKLLLFGKLFVIAVLLKLPHVASGCAYVLVSSLLATGLRPPAFAGEDNIEDLTRREFDAKVPISLGLKAWVPPSPLSVAKTLARSCAPLCAVVPAGRCGSPRAPTRRSFGWSSFTRTGPPSARP